MLHFIPAWYQQNSWCENEQVWYARRTHSEFDDTVKHVQLFHRSKAYPFQIMLLSYAPNFRHFLHRQSVFHAPYWSCFDAIQEVRRKKVRMFSFHNLNWPAHIEFVYSPFALVALLNGHKYAQVEFGEDGNPIQVDIYQNEMIQRRNIYDDRGFVSGSILFEEEDPVYQDYLTDKGVWKLREYWSDGHVEVNPQCPVYLLEHEGREYVKTFSQTSYESMDQIISEVLNSYLALLNEDDIFCVAMHSLHKDVVKKVIDNKKMILSFYGDRYDILEHPEDLRMVKDAGYIITDSRENLKHIQKALGKEIGNIVCITPFDSRVDFGISQQLNVQKIMVPVDGMEEERLHKLIQYLGKYLLINENARIHLFTRVAAMDRSSQLLEFARRSLKQYGFPKEWADEAGNKNVSENIPESAEKMAIRFFVDQCVDELAVSKCIREQRIIVDVRNNPELYLRITGISVGIPQIVSRKSEFVEHGKNGLVVKDMNRIPQAIAYYLDSLNHWNKAMVYSYELGKRYTTSELVERWKEVIEFVGCDSGSAIGE